MSTQQAKTDTLSQERNIEKALKNLCAGASCHQVARLVHHAAHAGRISYGEAKQLLGEDLDEALLTAVHLRLLIPVRSVNDSLNWVDAVLLFEPGEDLQNAKHRQAIGAAGRVFRSVGDRLRGIYPVSGNGGARLEPYARAGTATLRNSKRRTRKWL